jgi:hypothetical protein
VLFGERNGANSVPPELAYYKEMTLGGVVANQDVVHARQGTVDLRGATLDVSTPDSDGRRWTSGMLTQGQGGRPPCILLAAPLRPLSLTTPTRFPLHLYAICCKLITDGPPG